MNTYVICVDIQTSIRDTTKKINDFHVVGIIMVENNQLVGIVTYKDLVRKNITTINSTDSNYENNVYIVNSFWT